jgi:hypothetical protein
MSSYPKARYKTGEKVYKLGYDHALMVLKVTKNENYSAETAPSYYYYTLENLKTRFYDIPESMIYKKKV